MTRTHIVLPWMNIIRRMRDERKSDTDIVNALFAQGLLDEKRIEKWYAIDAVRYSKRELKNATKTLEKLSSDIDDINIE